MVTNSGSQRNFGKTSGEAVMSVLQNTSQLNMPIVGLNTTSTEANGVDSCDYYFTYILQIILDDGTETDPTSQCFNYASL